MAAAKLAVNIFIELALQRNILKVIDVGYEGFTYVKTSKLYVRALRTL